MKLPEIGVKRPIATAMFFILLAIMGLVSLKMLPVDMMPAIEFPSITVITVYPGAAANEVEEQVTKPLEAVLSSAEGLKDISSKSKENISFIKLNYTWGSNVDAAANNTRDLLEFAKSRLPSEVRNPIIYKINSSMMPVIMYGVSAKESYNTLGNILEDDIATPLRKAEGVGTVVYLGQPEREIHVNLDPQKLAAYKISPTLISTIIKAENLSIPTGNITVGPYDFAVRLPEKITDVQEFENIVITSFAGHIIRLKDIADIQDTYREKEEFARLIFGEGAAMMIQKQTDANTLDVVKSVRAEMEKIKEKLPEDITIKEILSSDEVISQSISNLSSSLWYALIFVSLVVLLFLRDWKSGLIIFTTMPISLISGFIMMRLMDYTINIFSLTSLVIAIGMVVDNAIVVLENITQHRDRGERIKQAAIFGTSEMGMAIAASTATTLVIFIPMVFIGGIVGIMFKQLATITCFTLIISLITSMTLTPMLSSKLIKSKVHEQNKKHGKLYTASENIFVKMEEKYKKILTWTVNHKAVTIVSAFVLLILSIFLGRNLGSDYIPNIDAGNLAISFHTEVGTSPQKTDSLTQVVLDYMVKEIPELKDGSLGAVTGQTRDGALTTVGFSEGKNIANILGSLVLPSERDRSAAEIANKMTEYLKGIPEIESFNVLGGSIVGKAVTGNRMPIEIQISGNDFSLLDETAATIESKLIAEPTLKEITTTIDRGKMEIHIDIDKNKASQMALNTALIGTQLRQSIYGVEAGDFTEGGKDFTIQVRYAQEHRKAIEDLQNMNIINLLGQPIPLSSIATIRQSTGMIEINRNTQERYVMVRADLNNTSLGDATELVNGILEEIDVPEGVSLELKGQVTDQGDSFSDLYLVFILGILLVYMVMAAQFESLKDPFIIMLAIPFASIGVILAFAVTGVTLSIVSFIGVIMLIGIVVNNGIILVDYTNMLRKRNLSLTEAVVEAGRSRLRPVLMTTLTTILGMLPMAINKGMGHEVFSSIAITIIGGLLISTLITLILVPTLYLSFNRRTLIREKESKNETI